MKITALCICGILLISACIAAQAKRPSDAGAENPLDFATNMASSGEDYLNTSDFPWFNASLKMGAKTNSYEYFSQFYHKSGLMLTGIVPGTPSRFDVFGREPSTLILNGSSSGVPFEEYMRTAKASGQNQLWIAGTESWSQYVIAPIGTWQQLIAYVDSDALADIYEIYPNDTMKHRQEQIYKGFNSINFTDGQVGRNIIFFIANEKPSNAVMIYVTPSPGSAETAAMNDVAGASGDSGAEYPSEGNAVAVDDESGIEPPKVTGQFIPASGPSTLEGPSPSSAMSGDTRVIVKSQQMKGYDVYVDDVMVGKDGGAGDALDGMFSLNVIGGQNHFIKVFDGEFFYGKSRYYPRGVTTTLWVEPGYALYVG
jgi:hypothetical protein